jgi:hypothetical protein
MARSIIASCSQRLWSTQAASSGPSWVGAEPVWTEQTASERKLILSRHTFVFMSSEQLSKYQMNKKRADFRVKWFLLKFCIWWFCGSYPGLGLSHPDRWFSVTPVKCRGSVVYRCFFYVTENGSLITKKACICRNMSWDLPCSRTWCKE